ncbi:NUDIX hydrolase [Neisseria yangbaofengii]|uniref:NUDIX hydrolase n=1 Tax=Neisseria yangbaofengii TaxID=2709396 RepID=UPI001D0254DA|nr:CoA pyrophosphatase [Neisseria yangbaofengii]
MTRPLSDFLLRAHEFDSRTQNLHNRFLNPAEYKVAAVLLAVIKKDHQWQILFTRRSGSLRRHTGQISLAGGRYEPQDIDLTQTALRETHEEVGILPQAWQTFPALPPHYTLSGYEVHPIPALCTDNPRIQTNPDEVAEVFYVPFDFAMNLRHYEMRALQHQGKTIAMPTLPFQHYDIWGLTAVILYGLAERYRQYCDAVPKHTFRRPET